MFNGNLKLYFEKDNKNNLNNFLLKIINYLKKQKIIKFIFQKIKNFNFLFEIVNLISKRKLVKNEVNLKFIEIIKSYKNAKILIHTLSSSEFIDLIIDLKNLEKNSNKIYIVFRKTQENWINISIC